MKTYQVTIQKQFSGEFGVTKERLRIVKNELKQQFISYFNEWDDSGNIVEYKIEVEIIKPPPFNSFRFCDTIVVRLMGKVPCRRKAVRKRRSEDYLDDLRYRPSFFHTNFLNKPSRPFLPNIT